MRTISRRLTHPSSSIVRVRKTPTILSNEIPTLTWYSKLPLLSRSSLFNLTIFVIFSIVYERITNYQFASFTFICVTKVHR